MPWAVVNTDESASSESNPTHRGRPVVVVTDDEEYARLWAGVEPEMTALVPISPSTADRLETAIADARNARGRRGS